METIVFCPLESSETFAVATFMVAGVYTESEARALAVEIAVGQSLGAYEPKWVDVDVLNSNLARIQSLVLGAQGFLCRVQFPWQLWHGRLDWLLTLLFGKISFLSQVSLAELDFSESCFGSNHLFDHASGKLSGKFSANLLGNLKGPKTSYQKICQSVGASEAHPLLMGILKPNVAMSSEQIAVLVESAFSAGCHLIKDDEIRHDATFEITLDRVSQTLNHLSRKNTKGIYIPHLPYSSGWVKNLKALEQVGCQAVLINVYSAGLASLQEAAASTSLLLVAHPALVGAFGSQTQWRIGPSVSMGSLLRASGADLTLFPSPYGKIGLKSEEAKHIALVCRTSSWPVLPTIPVPSAGIKPEHVPLAKRDFGSSQFVLNAGTAIFASDRGMDFQIAAFRKALEL